jgi:hypothetical protein
MKQREWSPGFTARGASYRRLPFQLGNPGDAKEALGLAILSALSITSVWSSVCPSFFTLATFGSQPEARDRATKGCLIGFGLSTATAAAIYLVFDEIVPAIIAEVTAVALLGISLYAIHSEPPKTIPPMEQQQTTPRSQPLPQATPA